MRIVVRDHDTHLPVVIDLPDAVHELDRQTGNLHLFGPAEKRPGHWGSMPAEWRVTLAHGMWLAILP